MSRWLENKKSSERVNAPDYANQTERLQKEKLLLQIYSNLGILLWYMLINNYNSCAYQPSVVSLTAPSQHDDQTCLHFFTQQPSLFFLLLDLFVSRHDCCFGTTCDVLDWRSLMIFVELMFFFNLGIFLCFLCEFFGHFSLDGWEEKFCKEMKIDYSIACIL